MHCQAALLPPPPPLLPAVGVHALSPTPLAVRQARPRSLLPTAQMLFAAWPALLRALLRVLLLQRRPAAFALLLALALAAALSPQALLLPCCPARHRAAAASCSREYGRVSTAFTLPGEAAKHQQSEPAQTPGPGKALCSRRLVAAVPPHHAHKHTHATATLT